MTTGKAFESRLRTRGIFTSAGAGTLLTLWILLVPWDFSSDVSSSRITVGIALAILASAAIAGGVAFTDRVAGQAFVVGAYLATLVLYAYRGITANDVLWVLGLLLVGLVALGAFVTACALGRLLRTGSAMD